MTASRCQHAVRAVVRKELRDYRRKRSIVVAMVILPVIFLIQPTLSIFLELAGGGRRQPVLRAFLSSSCF